MEAFFRNDQEIREWVDLLIEKLFTVNLLSGRDADSEFHQGQQLVGKIALSFQEMVDLPKEVLVDGIRQLVEQRLPDHRVIDNFPDFYQLMNDMISSGLQSLEKSEMEYFPQQLTNLKDLVQNTETHSVPSSKIALKAGQQKQELDSSFSLRHHLLKAMDSLDSMGLSQGISQPDDIEQQPDIKVEAMIDEVVQHLDRNIDLTDVEAVLISPETKTNNDLKYPNVTSKSLHELIGESMKQLVAESHTSIDEYTSELTQSPIDDPNQEKDMYNHEILEDTVPALSLTISKMDDRELPAPFLQQRDPFRFNTFQKAKKTMSTISTAKPSESTQPIPQKGMILARVIKQLYGDSPVQWNVTIEEYLFLAKIDSLLVHVLPDNTQLDEEFMKNLTAKMKKNGYKVFACFEEDLSFPRRLERGIRRSRDRA